MTGFPSTRRSALLAVRSQDAEERRRGYGAIVAVYWKPAYAYVRLRWKEAARGSARPGTGLLRPRLREGLLRTLRSGARALPNLVAQGTVNTVEVPSPDDTLRRVQPHGGAIAVPKMPIPGVGWLAYCTDTEPNTFGIMQPDETAR